MMKIFLSVLTMLGLLYTSFVLAADAAAPTPPAANPAVGPKDRVHFKKSKKLDFSSQTVEGNLQRPETSLITASENLTTNGILRLRENFIDKYSADVGETVP